MVVETRAKRRQQLQEILDRLPEELIEEILKRLPVRSLVRFSCTCKRWRSLILCDSKFSKSHIVHAKRPSWKFQKFRYGTIYQTVDCDCNIVRLLPKETLTDYPPTVLGSCNGLLFWCVSSDLDGRAYGLWNPYTNSVRRIIDAGVEIDFGGMGGLSYDRANDDYKAVVVQVFQSGKQSPYVFSLRRNSWKKLSDLTFDIRNTFTINLGYDRVGITPDNGICFWQIKDEISRTSSIICFDPVVEEFKKVPLPDKWSGTTGQQFQIGALDGCLSLIHINNIWVMKEYVCWTKLHVLQLNCVEQMGEINTYKPLGYNSSKDEMVVIARGPGNLNWRIWMADLKKGVLRKPGVGGLGLIIFTYNLVPYSESLLCPWVGLIDN